MSWKKHLDSGVSETQLILVFGIYMVVLGQAQMQLLSDAKRSALLAAETCVFRQVKTHAVLSSPHGYSPCSRSRHGTEFLSILTFLFPRVFFLLLEICRPSVCVSDKSRVCIVFYLVHHHNIGFYRRRFIRVPRCPQSHASTIIVYTMAPVSIQPLLRSYSPPPLMAPTFRCSSPLH